MLVLLDKLRQLCQELGEDDATMVTEIHHSLRYFRYLCCSHTLGIQPFCMDVIHETSCTPCAVHGQRMYGSLVGCKLLVIEVV
jgi:hypothetical protein